MKSGQILFFLFFIASFGAAAADNELRGYTPPPMFGGSSTPISPPPATAPAQQVQPAPEVMKAPAPVVEKPIYQSSPPPQKAAPVAQSPAPSKPQPAPVAQITTPAKPEASPAQPVQQFVQQPLSPPPVLENAGSGVDAEALLNHPVTSPQPTVQPVANSLPLPNSVPDQKKIAPKKIEKTAPVKKETAKKTELQKASTKPVLKKPDVKKEEPKKPAVKTASAPKKAPVQKKPDMVRDTPKLDVKPKAEVKKEPVTAAAPAPKAQAAQPAKKTEALIAPAKTETAKPEPAKTEAHDAYNIKGRKSMPTSMPAKVDRAELTKLPLPAIEPPAVKTLPTANEKMIDMSLQDHLVEPDVKKIAAPDSSKSPATAQKKPVPVTAASDKLPDKIKPQLISLGFKGEAADLPDDLKKVIDAEVLPRLKADKGTRLQILSYAAPSKEGQSSARRISLARGLSVRAYMLEKSVEPDRIDIRALGENTTEKPLDRVDLMIISYK